MQDGYYSCVDIAKMTNKKVETVWKWIREGKLKANRPGGREYVIKHDDFIAFMESDNRKGGGAA